MVPSSRLHTFTAVIKNLENSLHHGRFRLTKREKYNKHEKNDDCYIPIICGALSKKCKKKKNQNKKFRRS